jgi:hypothetical protein
VALEVDVDDRVPLLLTHREDHPVAQDPGVVDQDVQLSVGVDGEVDQGLRRGQVGDVAAVGDGPAALGDDLGHGLVGRGR